MDELYEGMTRFVARRVPAGAVDDLVQEIFAKIAASQETVRDQERLSAFCYRVARNAIVDYYRRAGRNRETAAEVEELAARAEGDPGEDAGAMRELSQCLEPLLSGLSPEQQDAVRWIDLQGLSQAEAAHAAEISLSGMKSRVQRGRRRLREELLRCCSVQLDARNRVRGYRLNNDDPNDPPCGSSC